MGMNIKVFLSKSKKQVDNIHDETMKMVIGLGKSIVCNNLQGPEPYNIHIHNGTQDDLRALQQIYGQEVVQASPN